MSNQNNTPTRAKLVREIRENPEVAKILDDMNTDKVRGMSQIQHNENDIYDDLLKKQYVVDEVIGDNILVEYIDNAKGEVEVGGIIVQTAVSDTAYWRTGVIRKVGKKVPEELKPETIVRFTNDRGIPMGSDKNYVFLNAERIFCTMKKRNG